MARHDKVAFDQRYRLDDDGIDRVVGMLAGNCNQGDGTVFGFVPPDIDVTLCGFIGDSS